ncbi:toll/interleukin-1 receptor domain-containing protein [Paenibacillus sp. ISL-20]|uniref:toll/interleukin-1 receptor domain-containing protein n=1 Tax=Paenibacillus sp. ISL-20 TaxID=2819163 RepID=UPI001BEC4012|nr:toll/interleukin-1 receptor domain-containing protein [Paenibacillus sp. ISL-20]MBT2764815.1 toll/interleukin-1 receptor domain-containing protein [Paenibacillus sp. ISL-20]
MDNRRPTAFISYSWDGEEHEKWVHDLVNRLRSDGSGIEASFDKFELYDKTVNLNQMMVNAIKDNDYVIVILTENYRNRADNFQGGVGFEAEILLADLKRNRDKIILVMRHSGDFDSVFPSYFRDYYAIDFSDDKHFEKKFDELVHRIYRHNSYEKAPLGSMPSFLAANLQPSSLFEEPIHQPIKKETNIFESFSTLEIRKSFTDLDKEEFLRSSYDEIMDQFTALFDHAKTQTPGFTYQLDVENARKHIYKLYIHGQHKTSLKMLAESGFSNTYPTIMFSIGNHSVFSENSFNEMLRIEEKNNQLNLRIFVSFRSKDTFVKSTEVVKRIWEDHLLPYLRN